MLSIEKIRITLILQLSPKVVNISREGFLFRSLVYENENGNMSGHQKLFPVRHSVAVFGALYKIKNGANQIKNEFS